MASVLIEWLVDLTRVSVNSTDGVTVREIVAAALFELRNKEPMMARRASLPVDNPSMLEWLFLYHTRLWKRPRLLLKDLYISMLNLSHDHKIGMGKCSNVLEPFSKLGILPYFQPIDLRRCITA